MGNMSGSYGSHYTLWQSITQNSQDIANNKSNVTVNMYLSFDGSSYYAYTNNATSGSMTINGSTTNYSIASINFSSGQAKDILLATWTGDIAHNDDGTKTLSVSGSWNTDTTRIGSGSCSTSKTLSTIPRASTVKGGSGDIGSTSAISITSASSSFKHTLRYAFGTLSGTIAPEVATSYTWTIPTSFYTQIPSAKTGTGTIYCDTYNGSTLIGTTSVQFTATANESTCRPTVSATIKDTNSTTTALTGDSSKLVKYKSTAQLVITSTVKNSATIKSVTVNGTNVGTSSSITLNYSNVSTASFTIVTTDSRGYVNTSYVVTPSYVNYVPLTINANFFRPQPTTGEVDLTYSGNYFNGSFGAVANTLSLTWKWKKKSDTSWTTGGTITPTLSGNTISQKTISLGTSFDYQTSYDFQIIAIDKLTTFTQTANVSVGMPVFYWGKDFFTTTVKAIMTTIRGKLENINGRITNANVEHSYENSKAHVQLLQATTSMTSNKPSGDGYILHFSWDNSGAYNGQLFIPNSSGNVPVQFRGCNNGTWGSWESLYRGKTLFDNSSGTTGTISNLTESVANFSYLEIYYYSKDDSSNITYKSTKIYSPNGKTAELSLIRTFTGSSVSQTVLSRIAISGTSITPSKYGYANVRHGDTGYVSSSSNYVYITKIVGYR